jgi:basic membrane protein A
MADTPYSEQATCDDGKTAVGYGSDAEPYAPCTIITNEWNWAAYYVPTVKSALDGTWKSQDWWGGFPEGAITMAGKAVPYIQDTITKLKAGFNPFCWISGQIKVNGEMKDITIPRCLDAMELLTMQWYVIGQQGEYPDNAAMPQ